MRLSDRWTARGAFGNGFRTPDLGQLYYRFANPASFYQVIGQQATARNLPDLQRAKEISAPFDQSNLFRIRNLIVSQIGPPRTGTAAALLTSRRKSVLIQSSANQQRSSIRLFAFFTRGFELDAEHSITRQLRIAGSYAFVDARDTGHHGCGLPQRHKHQGFMRTEYTNARLGLLANVRGTFFSNWLLNPAAGTRAFGYDLWDFYISKNLPRATQVYFSIDNFADRRDQKARPDAPAFDRPDYGRLYRVGLRWRIGGIR